MNPKLRVERVRVPKLLRIRMGTAGAVPAVLTLSVPTALILKLPAALKVSTVHHLRGAIGKGRIGQLQRRQHRGES